MNYSTLPKFQSVAQARKLVGVSYLGSINSSAKIMKNQKVSGHYTYIIYLPPALTSGYNVCPGSTPECRLGCLSTSGHAAIEIASGKSVIRDARITKTRLFIENPDFYMSWVIEEMKRYQAKAIKDGYHFSARLNGTSDIDYRRVYVDGKNIFEHFPDVIFYDYTKCADRYITMPKNYQLTFSYTGLNWLQCQRLLDSGKNVAIVFNLPKKKVLPVSYKGYVVTNGDLTDLRVDEARGVIIGLYWKNIANKVINNHIKSSIFAVQMNNPDLNLSSLN